MREGGRSLGLANNYFRSWRGWGNVSPILPILRRYFASSACVKAQNKPLLSVYLMTYFAASLAVSQLYHTAGCAPM